MAQRRAGTITYKGLANEIGRPEWVSPFNASLYVIAAHLLLKGLPPITALVVNGQSLTTQDWLLQGRTFEHTLEEIYNHPWDADLFNGLLD